MDIFFHVYLKNDFSHILLSKFKKFKASGLYDNANKIYLTLFGDIERHQEFLSDLKDLYSKIEYAVIVNQEFNNEADSLNFVLKKASEYTENTPMLYLHTKGVSYSHPEIKKNVNAWVRYLDLYVINKWEECLQSLNNYDIAGPFYTGGGGLGSHFQGNFWWANSEYLKTLPKIDSNNIEKYNRGEFWVASQTDNANPLCPISQVDLYQTYYCNEADFPNGW